VLASIGIYAIFASYLGLMILIPGAMAILVFLLLISRDKAYQVLSRAVPGRILPKFHEMMNAFKVVLRDHRKSLYTSVVMSGARMLTYGLGFWVLLQGLSIDCPFSYSFFATVIAQLTTFIPISIMGLGTSEAVIIYCLLPLHIAPVSIIAAQFVGRIIYISWLFLFFVLFRSTGKQLVDESGSS
jgi:uncharacterized membrane protein YbhN (UPF0104 family)